MPTTLAAWPGFAPKRKGIFLAIGPTKFGKEIFSPEIKNGATKYSPSI